MRPLESQEAGRLESFKAEKRKEKRENRRALLVNRESLFVNRKT